ncbi:MAG: hypothetical protein ACP5UA_11480 [Candidatus Hydrogenedens sp.]
MKMYHKSTRNLFLIPVVCLVMSGCIGGCFVISDIKFTTPLIKGATIPGGPDVYIDKDIALPRVCGQFNMEKIKEQIKTAIQALPIPRITSRILLMLINNVEIKNLWIEKLTITATEGNFSKLQSLAIKVKIGNGEIDFGQGSFSDDKTSIVFEKDPKVDIYPYIKSFSDGGCVEGNIHIIGYNSQTDIKVDVVANVSLKVGF